MRNWMTARARRGEERQSATLPPAAVATLGEQLTRALTTIPVPPGARARTWHTIETRIRAIDQQTTAATTSQRLGRRPARSLATAALVVAVVVLSGLSPVGQQALALASETLTVTLFRLAPDGTMTPERAEAVQVGNTVVILNGMIAPAEAERQAGFPIRQPRILPANSRLLGAHVSTQAAGTAGEWRELALSYAVGDRLLRLTQAHNRGVVPASDAVIGMSPLAAAPAGEGAPTPQAPPAESSTAGTASVAAVPLRKERQPMTVGSAAGTLETTFRPDGSVLDRMLTWQVGTVTYELSGPFSSDELLAIARSI